MAAAPLDDRQAPRSARTVLRCLGVGKRYGGVQALAGVDFHVDAGQVHALLGENGAGKSTLIKIVSGAVTPDDGVVEIGGTRPARLDPGLARRLGVSTIHQETSLFPSLSVLENLFTGQLLHRAGGRLDWPAMRERAARVIAELGVPLPLDAAVDTLDRSSAQIVEIARALVADARLLIMDEPTAALSAAEAERLFAVVEALRARGTAVVYVSHHLEEVFRLADVVTVLRDGKLAGHAAIGDIDTGWIVERMIGRPLAAPVGRAQPGVPAGARRVLEVAGAASGRAFVDVSFEVHAGEVVALVGLIGSGRQELVRALVGLEPLDAGALRLDGATLLPRAGAHLRAGIGFVPQNRQSEGLVTPMSASVNISLATLGAVSRAGVIDRVALRERAEQMFAQLQVRPTQPGLPASAFSGGNQQKLVLGRWLLAAPKLLLVEEPTQGVDVGAKDEIHRVIDAAVAAGLAVLVASSDLPEVERIAHRTLAMRKGRIVAELPAGATAATLLAAIAGEAPIQDAADAQV
jgi:ABC-type sugar transport system ATPase subunit